MTLVTVIRVPGGESPNISPEWPRQRIDQFEKWDDVFHKKFLQGVVLCGETMKPELSLKTKEVFNEQGSEWVSCHSILSGPNFRPGTYAWIGGYLWPVWKLYRDTEGALSTALAPDLDKSAAIFATKICRS